MAQPEIAATHLQSTGPAQCWYRPRKGNKEQSAGSALQIGGVGGGGEGDGGGGGSSGGGGGGAAGRHARAADSSKACVVPSGHTAWANRLAHTGSQMSTGIFSCGRLGWVLSVQRCSFTPAAAPSKEVRVLVQYSLSAL